MHHDNFLLDLFPTNFHFLCIFDRKFVVGFAFMVPDVKYNETYISFIFTHPEFRRVGIASFMLYHLFHVSSINNYSSSAYN